MILVVGPGSIGGVLDARWALRGHTTLLLGRSAASETRLLRHHLIYSGPDGRRRTVRGLQGARDRGPQPCEAAFFCGKSQDLPTAARAAKPWIGASTGGVRLQNGVD